MELFKKEDTYTSFFKAYSKMKKLEENRADDKDMIQALSETYSISPQKVKSLIKQRQEKRKKQMKQAKRIFWLGLIIITFLTIVGSIMSIHYSNKQVQVGNLLNAQQKVCRVSYDNMFKTIKQKAQVVNKGAEDFKEISGYLISERYKQDNGKLLVKWIKEDNPNFDMSMYKDLMATIEHMREVFMDDQKVLIDLDNTYKNLIQTAPAKWFTDETVVINVTIVTSSKTKDVYKTGEENDISIF